MLLLLVRNNFTRAFKPLTAQKGASFSALRFLASTVSPNVTPKPYGFNSITEHKHVQIFKMLDLTDKHPDRFYDLDELSAVSVNDRSINERDIGPLLEAVGKLQRYKLGFSTLQYAKKHELLRPNHFKQAANLLFNAYVANVVSEAECKPLADYLLSLAKNAPQKIFDQIRAVLRPFDDDENPQHSNDISGFVAAQSVYRVRALQAIRNRDFNAMKAVFETFPEFSVDRAILFDEFFGWVKKDPSMAVELVSLALKPFCSSTRGFNTTLSKHFIDPLNTVPHLPKFIKVDVSEDGKCSSCRHLFQPKPFLSLDKYRRLFPSVKKYALGVKYGQNDIIRIERFSQDLIAIKNKDPLKRPICVIDAPNVAYGADHHLGEINNLRRVVEYLYAHFSCIGIVSKFSLPMPLMQQFVQMRVKVLQTFKHINDDIAMILLFTLCGNDTYVVTNDEFRDHFMQVTKNVNRSMKIRLLRHNKESHIVEVPTSLSPYVQETPHGFHIPVRKEVIRSPFLYEYYCWKAK